MTSRRIDSVRGAHVVLRAPQRGVVQRRVRMFPPTLISLVSARLHRTPDAFDITPHGRAPFAFGSCHAPSHMWQLMRNGLCRQLHARGM